MKASARVLTTAVLTLIAITIVACVPSIKSAKPQADGKQASAEPREASGLKKPRLSGEGGDHGQRAAEGDDPGRPVSEPRYEPPPPPDTSSVEAGAIDLRLKEEVNTAALKFAKSVPGVKHVKTCYSKLYGGWYLLLYVQSGNKVSLQQYSWNDKTQEWEVIYYLKEIPEERLEHHLKGEVADEKCFILK